MDDATDLIRQTAAAGAPHSLRPSAVAGEDLLSITFEECQTVVDCFEWHVHRTPQNTAVKTGDEELTYQQLNTAANRLAWTILERSSTGGPGASASGTEVAVSDAAVVVFMELSSRQVVAALGVLKAGKVYVPVDPSDPPQRVNRILDEVAARWLIVDGENAGLAHRLAPAGCEVIVFDDRPPGPPNSADPRLRIAPNSLGYVVFTSGSTGAPKGVMHTHANLLHDVRARSAVMIIRPTDRVSLLTSATGQAIKNMLVALVHGAALYPKNLRREGTALLVNWLAGNEISVMVAPAPLFRSFIGDLSGPVELPRLRLIRLGSDRCFPGDVSRFQTLFPPTCVLINGFSTSETGRICSVTIDHSTRVVGSVVPVGRPVPDFEVRILDEQGRPVPAETPGTIAVRSRYVSTGYWRRADLTARTFLSDPHEPGVRTFVSADRGYLRGDGQLVFLERRDHQVKIRGFLVDTLEVEAALLERQDVRAAVVRGRRNRRGDTRLVAYVVPAGAGLAPAELRKELAGRLSAHMLPSHFVILADLPKLSGGKVDNEALPEPPRTRPLLDVACAPAETPTETCLTEIWKQVLDLAELGIDDPFLDLGGDSLLAMQVLARVIDAFGVEVALPAFFDSPTIRQMAREIDRFVAGRRTPNAGFDLGEAIGSLRSAAHLEQIPRLETIAPEEGLPLSFAQERLWFISQFEPGSAVYNLPRILRLRGELNVPALEQSLREVLRRHQIVRTVVRDVGGEPHAELRDASQFTVAITDLWSLPLAGREAEAQRLAFAEFHQPFDLARDLMLRAHLWVIDDRDHLLSITRHHIASDFWSGRILSQEISALYAAFLSGRPSPLPELPFQYVDFAAWQRRWLCGDVLERQLAYWKQNLAGAPALLNLPTDRPRPAMPTDCGGLQELTLNLALTQEIDALCRRNGVTLFMTLLAAFQVLLARYSGQDDVLVGGPISGRSRTELEGLIGFFVNTLVFRSDLSGNPSFEELLKRVRATALGAFAHQDLPFEKLVVELRPERNLGRNPLFQVAFVLQNGQTTPLELPGLAVEPVTIDRRPTRFDLLLLLRETSEGLSGHLEYNSDLFDPDRIARMASHFVELLRELVQNPERPIGEAPLLTPGERRRLLFDWSRSASPAPSPCGIHELFEQQVERTPDAVALEYGSESRTYREVNTAANHVASQLIALGVGPGDLVGCGMQRSLLQICGLLGILKAGAAYLPLDSRLPPLRREQLMSDARPAAILTDAASGGVFDNAGIPTICLDDSRADAPYPVANPRVATSPDSLAYVMYTSGSTGAPKGVEVLHRGVTRLVCGNNYAELEPGVRVAHLAPLAFDASTFEIWGPLLNGGCCVILPDGPLDLGELEDHLQQHRVDTLWLTATLFNTIIDERPQALRAIGQLLTGGEALSAPHVRRAFEVLPAGVRLINGYGPTECTTFACCHPITQPPHPDAASIPIGKPIAQTTVYVLDRHRQPVPVGVPGELYIGGAGVARGYRNRPELTAEKFVRDPFSTDPQARLYRTGDLVAWRADGALDFLGRQDDQVKLRGFRIELGEIEAHLASHPLVRRGAVVLREGQPGDRRLVACLETGRPLDQSLLDELRSHLRDRLPDYMIPSQFVAYDRLPLTSSGKIDRWSLREAQPTVNALDPGEVAPRTPAEKRIMEIWSTLLDVSRVGVHDNFFALGGHSLLATRAISRVRDAFGVDLTVRSLFDAPTPAGLAACIERKLSEGPFVDQLPPPAVVPREATMPLSFGQQRLWFLEQLEGDLAAYNMKYSFRVRGALDVEALRRALEAIVHRHEPLRTNIVSQLGEPAAVLQPPTPLELPLLDLRDLPLATRSHEVVRLGREVFWRPFDLSRDLMLRGMVLRLTDDAHQLLLSVHHIASDGWSQQILFRELSALYTAFRSGLPSPLPPLTIQYVDHAACQQRELQGVRLRRLVDYWRGRLEGVQGLELPTDFARPAHPSYRGARHRFRLTAELVERLEQLSQSAGATLHMALLAAFQLLLSRCTGQEDIAVGTPIAGRRHRAQEGLIGFFVNTLVLRTDLSGNPTFCELLRRVREVSLGAYEHQDLPFEKLVEELQPARHRNRSPLVQAVFQYVDFGGGNELELPGLQVDRNSSDTASARFDLEVMVRRQSPGLLGNIIYAADLFRPETITRLAEQYVTLLQTIVADPERPIRDLSSPAESAPSLPTPRLSDPAVESEVNRRRSTGSLGPSPSTPEDPPPPTDEQATRLESEVAAIWSDLLGRTTIGRHEQFFDLGGHSLLAMKLLARIEARFGRRLPVALLFQQGSIAQIARRISHPAVDQIVSLVALRPGRPGGRTLFIAPSLGGMVSVPRRVIEGLDPAIAVFALQPRLDEETVQHFDDLPRVAGLFANLIREAQPHGRYCLMGYCSGGNLAYEIARQLTQQGGTVEFLGLLDSGPRRDSAIREPWARARWLGRVARNFPHWVRYDLLQSSPGDLWRRLQRKLRWWRKKIRRRLEGQAAVPELDDVLDLNRLAAQSQRLRMRTYRALQSHITAAGDLHITLLSARARGLFHGTAPDLGWLALARRGVEIVTIPGNHVSMLSEPYVQLLIDALNQRLARQESSSEPSSN